MSAWLEALSTLLWVILKIVDCAEHDFRRVAVTRSLVLASLTRRSLLASEFRLVRSLSAKQPIRLGDIHR